MTLRRTVSPPAWRPDWRTALPRVSYARWWLFRLAMVVVVVFFFAAAMLPILHCGGRTPPAKPRPFISPIGCPEDDLLIVVRLEIAATGVLIALALAFI